MQLEKGQPSGPRSGTCACSCVAVRIWGFIWCHLWTDRDDSSPGGGCFLHISGEMRILDAEEDLNHVEPRGEQPFDFLVGPSLQTLCPPG